MRRRLAAFLSLIIVVSLFQGISIYGAESETFFETHQFVRTQEGLYEKIGATFDRTAMTSGAEEAAFKWKMQENLDYKFTYDVISSTNVNETNKINLAFNLDGGSIKLNASLLLEETPIETKFTHKPFPYNKANVTTTADLFTYDLMLNPDVAEKRELSLIIGNTPIRILIDKDIIHIWTGNIKKGYITDFTLMSQGELQAITVMNGLRSFEIKPVHLIATGGALGFKDIIDVNDNVQPGSSPGVQVSFEKPKSVAEGEYKFSSISGGDETATLAIWGEQRPGIKDATRVDNERSLNYKLVQDAHVKDTTLNLPNGKNVGAVYEDEDNNTISIYISKYLLEGDATVVEWKSLEASMLLSGQLVLTGGVFDKINSSPYTPQNNGHTYLAFKAALASEEQVAIEIIPYNINGTVNYTLKERQGGTGATGSFVSILTRTHTRTQENKNDVITIHIPRTKADVYYQIEVDIGGNSQKLNSQQLRFMPSLEIAPPPITQIIRANNVYVVPSVGGSAGLADAIGFDIEWTAPSYTELQAMLAKGDIYYELTLYDKRKQQPEITKVFRISRDTSEADNVKVTLHGGTEYATDSGGKYNRTTGTFEVKRVVIQAAGETKWESLDLDEDRFDNPADYPDSETIISNANLEYTVPGIYYLSMKGIMDLHEDDELDDLHIQKKKLAVSKESSIVSLAIDYAVEIIPTPSGVRAVNRSIINESTQEINYDIEIENVDIRKYVSNMLEPAKVYLDDPRLANSKQYKGTYEIFIYQKSNEQSSDNNYTEAKLIEALKDVIPREELQPGNKLDVTNYLERLRKGEIIAIEYLVEELEGKSEREVLALQNLDSNQVYYIRVRLRLDPLKLIQQAGEETLIAIEPLLYSIFSSTYTFTTTTTPEPPKPEDEIPPAPKSIWVDSQPNNTTAILKWTPTAFVPEQGSHVYYELVRSTEVVLKENEKRNKVTLQELVGSNSNLVGFHTSKPNIMTIEGSGPETELKPVQESQSFRLEDITLSPNTIYYYYVRTVYAIDNQHVRSEWIMVPVTTRPVEKPIKLQIETPSKYFYNPKTETVISFLAPIPAGANIPNDYNFEIAIQSEMEDDYRLDYAKIPLTSLEDPELVPTGYRHFVYKITQLKPGKRYDIKVRIVDNTGKVPASGIYPRSLYSDKVIARTEFDQDDQDRDNKFDEYLKRYDDEVEKLRRKAYWEVNSESRFEVIYKYRASYINAEMAIQNTYELQTKNGMNRATYYFPASMLDKASDLNVVINSVLGNEAISLRPYTLTPENQAIKEAVYQKSQKKIKDYYIKLDFIKKDSTQRINGEERLSPEITIDLALVYLDQEDIFIEDDIMIALNNLIKRERIDVISQLEKQLTQGVINDEVLKVIIDRAVSHIEGSHQTEVRRILRRQAYKDSWINEIEKPILITSLLDSFSVNGYYLEGSWSSVEVMQANGGFIIEAIKLGTYVFTGVVGIASTIPGIAQHQSMIARYNLTDFFTLDAYMIKTATTKRQLYGATARILGAKRNTDYIEYLRVSGIKGISTIGMDRAIRQDEAIYVMMQVYEKIYNKPISTISIKNKQSVTNIGAFQAQYRPYVYAAVELKIVQNPNTAVLPSKEMTVEETLKMLVSIIPK